MPKHIGKKVKNIAQPKAVSEQYIQDMIDAQIFEDGFRSDYEQIKKRFKQRNQGLINGAPPPRVE